MGHDRRRCEPPPRWPWPGTTLVLVLAAEIIAAVRGAAGHPRTLTAVWHVAAAIVLIAIRGCRRGWSTLLRQALLRSGQAQGRSELMWDVGGNLLAQGGPPRFAPPLLRRTRTYPGRCGRIRLLTAIPR